MSSQFLKRNKPILNEFSNPRIGTISSETFYDTKERAKQREMMSSHKMIGIDVVV
jgi:hypothetical protein